MKPLLIVLNVFLVVINTYLYGINPEDNALNLLIAGIWFVVFLLNLLANVAEKRGDKEDD